MCPVCEHPQRRKIDILLFEGSSSWYVERNVEGAPDQYAITEHKNNGHIELDKDAYFTVLVNQGALCKKIIDQALNDAQKPPRFRLTENGEPAKFPSKLSERKPLVSQALAGTALKLRFAILSMAAKLKGIGDGAGIHDDATPQELKELMAFMQNTDPDAAARAAQIVIQRTAERIEISPTPRPKKMIETTARKVDG